MLEEIADGLPGRQTQDMNQRSYFGLKDKPEGAGWIDPAASTNDITRKIRALDHAGYDNPVAAPWVMTASGPILVGEAEAVDDTGAPGAVLGVDATSITVAISDGALQLSRLRDGLGNDLDPTGMITAGETLSTPHIDTDAITASAKVENTWRNQFADYRPADWAARAGEGGMNSVAIEAGGADPARLAAAFGAVIAAASGGDSVDLAFGRPVSSDLQAGWAPVRFDTDASWSAAQARMAADMDMAETKAPFAADLLARIAEVPRQMPMAGISAAGGLPGVALTLVTDGSRLEVDTNVITKTEAELIAARISALLASDIADNAAFAALPLLPEAERKTLIEDFNDTWVDYPADLTMHGAFEAQVKATPDDTALVYEATPLTYYELNAKANRLAHVLRDMGVAPGQPVGLHMTRSENMVIAALAILKAGGAYVPLDPEYPADRIEFYAADSEAKVIVSEEALPALVPAGATRILADKDPRIATAPATNPDSGVTAADLACLLYTSPSPRDLSTSRMPSSA